MKKYEKIDQALNDTFVENLQAYLNKEYPSVNFESAFNMFSMRLQTTWDSEDPIICEQIKRSVRAYEQAYMDASMVVRANP